MPIITTDKRPLATGGTITFFQNDDGTLDEIHTFTTNAAFFARQYLRDIRVLIVGGGANGGTGLGSSADCGAGWRIAANGGGGGGVIDQLINPVQYGSYNIVVGQGNAQNSNAFSLTAYGAAGGTSGAPTAFAGGQIAVQWCSTRLRYTSGGGATAAGTDSNGGQGKTSDISGSSVIYGSGGGRGGQSNDSGQGYLRGASGGTNAGNGGMDAGSMNAVANTGSGGGGGAMYGNGGVASGGVGASGIVIVRFPYLPLNGALLTF